MGTIEWSHISYCGLCCFEVEVLSAQHMTGRGGDFYLLNESCRAEVERSLGRLRGPICLELPGIVPRLCSEVGNCKSRHGSFLWTPGRVGNIRADEEAQHCSSEHVSHEALFISHFCHLLCPRPWSSYPDPLSLTSSLIGKRLMKPTSPN